MFDIGELRVVFQWPPMKSGSYYHGLVRRYPVECCVDKAFIPNNRFEIRGKYVKNSELFFNSSDEWKVFRGYRTHYGYCFAHNGLIFADSNNNLRLAMRRLLACRAPDGVSNAELIYDYEMNLREMQISYIRDNGEFIVALVRSSCGVLHHDSHKSDDLMAMLKKKHDKRILRIRSTIEAHSDGRLENTEWTESVLWKLKKDEYSKPGKYGRMIVDLGVIASLEGGLWAEMAKKHIGDHKMVINNCCFVFCSSPDPDVVLEYMKEVWYNDNRYAVMMVVFSDDAIVGALVDGVWQVYNLDISSCDTSHCPPLFHLMFEALNCPTWLVNTFINQMKALIRIESSDKKQKAFAKPKDLYLQSGSVITTITNVFAQLLIFHSLSQGDVGIVEAARRVGYVVTLETCEIIEDMQFLKMSPTYDTEGVLHACLNLGVIFRASGTCRGDVPKFSKHRDFESDANRFQSQLMSGLLARVNHSWLNKLAGPLGLCRDATALANAQKHVNALRHITAGYVPTYDDSIYKRYRLTQLEIFELHESLETIGVGVTVYSNAVHKILKKDYGLEVPLTDRKSVV